MEQIGGLYMNFNEALNIPDEIRYTNEGFKQKYSMIIEALGYEDVKQCVPFSIDELKKAYESDVHFNNLPLRKWDSAAGYTGGPARCIRVGSRLTRLYWERCKVNTYSCSDGVCILKECARMWVEE